MKLKDESELAKFGYALDPTDPTQAIPIGAVPTEEPDDSWTVERLGAYAMGTIGEATILARKSTVQLFRAGRALSIARKSLTDGRRWGLWLATYKIPRTTAWEAIQLFERAGTEGRIADMTISQAKRHFNIASEPKQKLRQEPAEVEVLEPIALRIADDDRDEFENDDARGETDDAEEAGGDDDEDFDENDLEEDDDDEDAIEQSFPEPVITIRSDKLDRAIQMWYADVERDDLIDLLRSLGIEVV